MCTDLRVSRDEPPDWLSCSPVKRQIVIVDGGLKTLFIFNAMQSINTTFNVLGRPNVDIFNPRVPG